MLEIDVGIGPLGAELGLGPGVGLQLEAGQRVIGVAVAVTVDIDAKQRAEAGFEAQVAADPQAGLGAGDVVEAGAVDIADADMFKAFGIGGQGGWRAV